MNKGVDYLDWNVKTAWKIEMATTIHIVIKKSVSSMIKSMRPYNKKQHFHHASKSVLPGLLPRL
jgi:hypothetical protein